MSNANDPMTEIKASFFIECEELLEALQDGLDAMDGGTADAETINVVFRAVHSIKGGAGAFGLDELVRFSHRFETLLDEIRSGKSSATGEILKVLFLAADHASDLVFLSRDAREMPVDKTHELMATLDTFILANQEVQDDAEEEIEFQPLGLALELDLSDQDLDQPSEDENADLPMPSLDDVLSADAGKPEFEIYFRPFPDLHETGNDPVLLLRNLLDLGTGIVTCDTSALPRLAEMVPDVPCLGWQVSLQTDADEQEIASVFEFVEGLCELSIARPYAQLATLGPCVEQESDPFDLDALPPPPEIFSKTGDQEEPDPTDQPSEKADPSENTPDAATPASTPTGSSKPSAAKAIVRVDLERIERLVNLVGELVINQAMLSQSLEQSNLSPHSDAMHGLEEFQRLTRDIQDSVMMIRAQPVKSLFQRMSRIVRETSSAVGKDVRLITEGEATEVDKTVIERLADPLTHMIRNAVDHGLEDNEVRRAAGKNIQGNVTLSAAHRSGRVVIEVSDDGGGINRERVLATAKSKGLVAEDVSLSDMEIDNLLFLPGFSTSKVVSDLSGRGVGMDVVRTAIQSLGGRITIQSRPGIGTSFSISMPLTLAVLDGMVIEVAGQTLVLPLNIVVETISVQPGDIQPMPPEGSVMRVRSGFVPIFDLGAALGFRPALNDPEEAVVLLIAQEDESKVALLIDNILDQRQVVIKGLDDSCYRAPGIAAATILGDGQIALILDPSDIVGAPLPYKIEAIPQAVQTEALA